ncbi:MAG: hypothetical protein PUI37_09200, partial [Oscillospiraceae bacterium]|nr:hypothetical protein [Oscillospiraceae bacterium]
SEISVHLGQNDPSADRKAPGGKKQDVYDRTKKRAEPVEGVFYLKTDLAQQGCRNYGKDSRKKGTVFFRIRFRHGGFPHFFFSGVWA